MFNICLKQVSEIFNELGSGPLEGRKESASLEEQIDILTQSLITMTEKVKEVQQEKHEKISLNFETSMCTAIASNKNDETEMKMKNNKTPEKQGADYNKTADA